MRTTAKLLTVCMAWGLLPASAALARTPAAAAAAGVAAWTVAQTQGDGMSDGQRRHEADQWLRQARTAMNNGDLQLAEYYLERAERLNANYDSLFARFQDTPERVRRDLERLRAARGQEDGGGPASLAAGRPVSQAAPDAPRRLPAPPDAARQSGFAAIGDAAPAGQPDAEPDVKRRARSLLLAARQALARKDAAEAERLAQAAESLGAAFSLHEDSPANVRALIARARPLLSPGPRPDPREHAQRLARLLMDEADGLALHGDLAGAERLAREAQALNAPLDGFERTPAQLLAELGRRRAAASDSAPQANKTEALRLTAEARLALQRGQLQRARQLAQQAHELNVPDTAFAPNETRPWQVLLEVDRAMRQRSGVQQAGGYAALEDQPGAVRPGVYRPEADATHVAPAAAQAPTPAEAPSPSDASPALSLYQEGVRALERHDRAAALGYFEQAWGQRDQLPPEVVQDLQDKLTLLRAPAAPPAAAAPPADASPLEQLDARQQVLREKLLREITAEQAEARRMSAQDPFGAQARLHQLRDRVSQADLAPAARKQLLTMVDRSIQELQQYIDANRADIELDQQNRAVLEAIEADQRRKLEVQNKLAELVEQFNTLIDEQRYAEAEVVAKQAKELDPESPVVQNLMWKSRVVRRMQEQLAIEDDKEQGFYDAATSVLASSAPFDDRRPYVLPDAKFWSELSNRRSRLLEQGGARLTPAEQEIQRSLSKQVDVRFTERPLSEVMDALGAMAGVNIYLDPQGLAAEGVTSETPVTINLTQPISLRSALNLVLEPLRLSYVIQNEVLRVTSEQTRNSDVYTKVYNVADLVIPIPNFIPGYNVGLPAAIREAHNSLGYGALNRPAGAAPLTVAANMETGQAENQSVLAQMGASGLLPPLNPSASRPPHPMGYGPGGMGGNALADFDTLINLIETTIAPDSWDSVGGPGAIEPFPTNLSLVISQTQEVHEQIADLLEQLRRLQDLQVTIEVRFITLRDNFFERIGIDFDFDVDDNVTPEAIRAGTTKATEDDTGASVTIGLGPDGLPTADFDLSFTQDSFNSTIPQFGGFDVGSAANFGFAILSDIEVFFLLQAAEGDTRSNVLQAPKVTLFNGQQASVFDTSQRPFVTGIIPVVGDFAAAHQPVVVVLSEGTSLTVQAVVSSDRRFVRLTLVPFFSRIGAVDTFTFNGRTTTNTGTNVIDPEGKPAGVVDNAQTVQEGVAVQLPTFIFTTVSTTVSVPDGGTVLLGGIKRLSEGRSERGVPMLSKLPYVNRLFKNVSIGRETSSLMMMVTPRIIIQEEEELEQTGYDSSAQ